MASRKPKSPLGNRQDQKKRKRSNEVVHRALTSMVKYALSKRSERPVKSRRSKNPYLFNLSWKLTGQGDGTHYYGGSFGMLDQILVNRTVLNGDSPFRLGSNFEILKYDRW